MRDRVIKYFWIGLTLTIAIVTVIVSTESVMNMRRAKKDSDRYSEQIAMYRSQIESDSLFIEQIHNSPEFAERYAREKYNMQRANETVYILTDGE